MISRLLFAATVAGFLIPSRAGVDDSETPDISTFHGIQLGVPITLDECPIAEASVHERAHYAVAVFKECYMQDRLGQALTPDVGLEIRFPVFTKHVGGLNVQLYNGTVECMHWATGGVASQTQDLRVLTTRLGEPKEVTRPEVQLHSGEKVETITAKWQLRGDETVTFESAPSQLLRSEPRPYQLDVGWVEIETAKCRANRGIRGGSSPP